MKLRNSYQAINHEINQTKISTINAYDLLSKITHLHGLIFHVLCEFDPMNISDISFIEI